MSNRKTTKRALLTSVMALVMCVVMLVGTTFAWFTDTASTGVNKIQAGNLDVDIIDMQGNSLDGKTLTWQKAEGAEREEVLWEPGCTYYLSPFQIQNKGNLALKYKIAVNGVSGDNKLLEALEFGFYYFSVGFGYERSLDELIEGGKLDNVAEHPGLCTAPIYIVAHMKEDAGNEYKGLSIDGIGITVAATQDAYESDSFDETYDEDATYPVMDNAGLAGAINDAAEGDTVVIASGEYDLPGAAVSAGATFAGAGTDKTTLKTNEKNYEFTGDNVTIKDVTIDGTKVSSIDNNGAIKITGDNAVLDNVNLIGGGGNTYGHTVRVDMKANTVTTIKNSTISGAFRCIQSFALNGTLLIENSTLAPQCYCLNVDGGTGKLVVNDSKLKGWTSYTNSVESATFTNCTFEVNPNSYGYNCVRAYTNTTFINCDFGDGFWFGAADNAVTVTFENCRFNGAAITASNVNDILDDTDNALTTVVVK